MDLRQLSPELAGTAYRQDGLLTREQCLAAGLPARRLEQYVTDGRWVRVLPRVYLTERFGGRELPPRVRVRAAWLWAGPRSVVAGHSAAWWLGLCAQPPVRAEVWAGGTSGLTSRGGVLVTRRGLDEVDIVSSQGLRTMSPIRAALDLAVRGSSDALFDLARRRELDRAEVAAALGRGRGGRGWSRARSAVAAMETNPWSLTERMLHRDLKQAGINAWVANEPLEIDGWWVTPDLRMHDVPLLIEVDGHRFHAGVAVYDRDRRRDARCTAAGWTVLRFTWSQIRDEREWVIGCILRTRDRLVGAPMPAGAGNANATANAVRTAAE